MSYPTSKELNEKRWYRLLKVISIILLMAIGIMLFSSLFRLNKPTLYEIIICPNGERFSRLATSYIPTTTFAQENCGKNYYGYKLDAEWSFPIWQTYIATLFETLIIVAFAFLIITIIKKIILYILYSPHKKE